MRTTVNIDDELLANAREFSGIEETAAVLRHALKRYVQMEAGRRLAAMGGSDPTARAAPRRRPPNFLNPE